MLLKYEKLVPYAIAPKAPKPGDLGVDLFSWQHQTLEPGDTAIVRTGIAIELPFGYGAILRPRGSDEFLIGSGVIDEGYRGEILVRLFNPVGPDWTDVSVIYIYPGDSVGQLILIPSYQIEVVEAKVDRVTDRGTAGGITGEHRA